MEISSAKIAEMVKKVLADMEKEETCPKGSVTSNTYLAVRQSDNRIVGVIDLRHHINHPILGLWGGHIGYSGIADTFKHCRGGFGNNPAMPF